jgi:Formyl transferase
MPFVGAFRSSPKHRAHLERMPAYHFRSVLICHDDEPLNRLALPRWLASFTDLAGIVVIHEPGARLRRRIRREVARVGIWRFLDVVLFRIYTRLLLVRDYRRWRDDLLARLAVTYPEIPASTRVLMTTSPNSREAEALLRETQPDFVIARCKNIISERVFRLPPRGVFVMHPGICPEYRNAHGCFWALANRDMNNVGMTLLKIDAGVDTGPVYGYFRSNYDEVHESHLAIQDRAVFDNLEGIKRKLEQVLEGVARPIDTSGRKSEAWGQPWLSAYLRWKRAAARTARRDDENHSIPVS